MATALNQIKMIYTYGEQDQFLTEDRISKLIEVVHRNALDIEISACDGAHKIDRKQLLNLFNTHFK